MSNFLSRLLGGLFGPTQEWWVEITTGQPNCTYYFGPFVSAGEAEYYKGGYIEDLKQEGAQDIRMTVKKCARPDQLTIDNEVDSPIGDFTSPALSGQS